jgi:phage terminase small subunit
MTDNTADGAAPAGMPEPAQPDLASVSNTSIGVPQAMSGRITGQRKRTQKIPRLNLLQRRFIDEYLKDFDGRAAAIRAGYGENGAHATSARLFKRSDGEEDDRRAGCGDRAAHDISVDQIVAKLKIIADFDPADFYHTDMTPKSLHEMAPEVRKALAGMKATTTRSTAGGIGTLVEIDKYIWSDRTKALELLAKYKRMFRDDDASKSEVTIRAFTLVVGC